MIAAASAVRERPVLMSGSMVRATLGGQKSQTRRVLKGAEDHSRLEVGFYHPTIIDQHGDEQPGPETFGAWSLDGEFGARCPYGRPGDRLYVRETWTADFGGTFSDKEGAWWHEMPRSLRTVKAVEFIYYAADESVYHGPKSLLRRGLLEPEHRRSTWAPTADDLEGRKWQPSIHMPRWASRLTLEITAVRVDRIQAISQDDAWAEGVAGDSYMAREAYRDLWNSLNAKRGYGWDVNPWVWALTFKVAA